MADATRTTATAPGARPAVQPGTVPTLRLPGRGGPAFQAQAVLVGSNIDLTALGSTDRTGGAPLVVELIGTLTGGGLPGSAAVAGGLAVLFRYGAVVFFDAAPAGITDYLRQIGPQIRQPLPPAERETELLEIRLDPAGKDAIEGNALVLAEVTLEKLQLVADIMAKSVSLAHHERNIERQFERIEPFAVNLDHWGRGGRAARELLQHLGGALLAEHRVVAGARVDDSPELLWDHPELERFWARLRDEFEIRERFSVLHGKLALISRTAETALELMQNRRALRVEWAIVGLIVFEIAVTLVQWAMGSR
ncbi:MAG: RMD1 family protein [Planctomycetia bacterium]|nr:RMD1 family protein [Planctomycetia bacterium]